MSALAFLQPDGGAAAARSPLARELRAAGATFETRDGWDTAVALAEPAVEAMACRRTVGFADRSQLGVLELQVPDRDGAALDALDPLPALDGAGDGCATRAGGAWWCRLTPGRALVVCEPGATARRREELSGLLPGRVLDVTAAYGAVVVAGPLARETFARFCALDLRDRVAPPRAVRPGSVARTPGLLLREGERRWLWLFGAAYASYVWTVLDDAATALGGRPVGIDALDCVAPVVAEAEVGAPTRAPAPADNAAAAPAAGEEVESHA